MTGLPICPKCETSRANAKTAGHRDWREGVCFDHAGVNIDDYFASIGFEPDEKAVARELAQMNALHARRMAATAPPAPLQLSLFE